MRIFLLISLLFSLSIFSFAQEDAKKNESSTKEREKANFELKKRELEIMDKQITAVHRMMDRTGQITGSLVNFFVGFGIGSFVQGDAKSGSEYLLIDLSTLIGYIGGSLMFILAGENRLDINGVKKRFTKENLKTMEYIGLGVLVGSGIVGLLSKIIYTIKPFQYSPNQIEVLPVLSFDPIEKSYNFAMNYRF